MSADEPRAEHIELSSGGVDLVGELLVPGEDTPLVVLSHGIPLSAPDPEDPGYAGLATGVADAGYSVLFVNFRGTGESGGDFHMGGWYEDIRTVMEYALSLGAPAVFMAGFSAGGALSIEYAARCGGVDGVVAFAAPARLTEVFPRQNVLSFIEVAREVGIIRELHFPPTPDWLYDDLMPHDALDHVAGVSPTPLLLVHGSEDELVPAAQARQLLDAAGEPKELVMLPCGEHRLRRDPRSVEVLVEWLGRR
ncbi:MAG: alpha/beta hydrolase [Actinobacteria bacterium]|nr:alpha/beta hydrolase [Actinomycetota bacterium]MBU1942529.1 alpha/beta hydrolase [Actinomycetota bacterium]MBU2687257.1 alpha/beta hydrolase [Actinomycetota bacterium]